MTLLRIVSDLHLEFSNAFRLPELPDDKNTILILSGDICVVEKAKHTLEFFRDVCLRFKYVIYVFGNHEYYHGSIIRALPKFKELLQTNEIPCDNLFILQKESIELDNIVFLGCTLWADFEKNNPISLYDANRMMNDFRVIRTGTTHEPYKKKWIAEYTYATHKDHLHWLTHELESNIGKVCVVITHHAPSYLSITEGYRSNKLNGAYASDLSDLIMNYQPKLMVHGHTHQTIRYNILDTEVVCNAKGYGVSFSDGSEVWQNPEFNPSLLIEL